MKFMASLGGRTVMGSIPTRLLTKVDVCKILKKADRVKCSGGWVRLSVFSARGPRPNNEDSALVALDENGTALIAVADGVGGLEKGEVASETAICVTLSHFAKNSHRRPDVWLPDAFHDVHTYVKKKAGGGATTLTVGVLGPWGLYAANVGDSPLYLATSQLTLVTKELDEGDGYITQALGHDSYRSPHLYYTKLSAPALVYAVSDGVDDVLKRAYPQLLSAKKNAFCVARRLVYSALRAGTRDNATAAVAFVHRLP